MTFLNCLDRKVYKRKKQKRGYELGIFEHSYTVFDWKKISEASSFKVQYTPGRKIKNTATRFILNSVFSFNIVFSNKKWLK